jgi:hypothetical protein
MSTGVKTYRITDPDDSTRFVDVDPYVIEGVPRAGVFYAQASDTVLRSMNVSSVTDNSTGNFAINLTNAMTNEDHYQAAMSGGDRFIAYSGSNTSSPGYNVYDTDGNLLDNDFNSVIIINDLA